MVPVGVVIILIGVGAGVLVEGPPAGTVLAITVGLLLLAAACWAVGLSGRIRDLRVVVPVLIVLGLCGAALDWPQSDGPGFVAGYMALAGLALRVPRVTALLAGVPIVAAIAGSDAHEAENPASTVLSVALGSGFLFVTSALVAVSQDAHQRAEALLAQEAAIREAREQTATLAERSRLAREAARRPGALLVQPVLAARGGTAAGQHRREPMPCCSSQISSARQPACDGMVSAQRAVQALRGDEIPGLARLPRLVTDSALSMRIPIDFQVDGEPWPLRPEAELTAYRTVQEALTNVAKHAGRGARVRVGLSWAPDCLDISVADSGGDGADAGLVSTGLRADQHGGASRAARRAAHRGPGGGRIHRPAEAPHRGHRPHGGVMTSARGARVRVLVADDQKVVRDGLSALLGLLPGIDVVGTAVDGEDAVRQARDLMPDVVLMDLNMPNCDGVEATRRLRQATPPIPVVVLTTYSDDDSVLAALRAGARGFLTKNASADEILQAMSASAQARPSSIHRCSGDWSTPSAAARIRRGGRGRR